MEGSGIGQFIPLILIFVIFYFFLIRPQQKKVKEHKAMVESLKRGDKVITLSPRLSPSTIALCSFTFFCCGLIKKK